MNPFRWCSTMIPSSDTTRVRLNDVYGATATIGSHLPPLCSPQAQTDFSLFSTWLVKLDIRIHKQTTVAKIVVHQTVGILSSLSVYLAQGKRKKYRISASKNDHEVWTRWGALPHHTLHSLTPMEAPGIASSGMCQ